MRLKEIHSIGSRKDFNDTWLCEMPIGTNPTETFSALKYNIKDFLRYGIMPEQITENVWRIVSVPTLIYWYEKDGIIQLATELQQKPEGLVVTMTGKDSSLRGKPPYASELYSLILKDSDKHIRIMSDILLSDEGYGIWKTLMKMGHRITIYNRDNPGHSMTSFDNIEDMDKFLKHNDNTFGKYQYVLSENLIKMANVRGLFNIRRYRETVSENNNLSD